MLETTRQYAREKLADSGELAQCAHHHLSYLTELFRRAGNIYEATLSVAASGELALELEDARAALSWGEQNDVDKAVDLFLATRLWVHLGLYSEGIERAKSLIALIAEDDSRRLARLWGKIALLAGRIGHYAAARDASEAAVRYARASNDADTLSDCLISYADVIAHFRRFDEAEAALDQAETCGKPTPRRRTQTLQVRGVIASIRGDLEMTARCFAELRDSYRAIGFDAGIVSATINLAEVEHARGATSKAVEIAALEVPRAERLPNRSDWAFLLRNLAGYLNATDDVGGARDAASKAITFYAAQDLAGPFTAIALEHLALSMAVDGECKTAATLEGYVQKTLAQLGFEREYTERTSHERLLRILGENLAKQELTKLLSEGKRLRASDALASARLYSESSHF